MSTEQTSSAYEQPEQPESPRLISSSPVDRPGRLHLAALALAMVAVWLLLLVLYVWPRPLHLHGDALADQMQGVHAAQVLGGRRAVFTTGTAQIPLEHQNTRPALLTLQLRTPAGVAQRQVAVQSGGQTAAAFSVDDHWRTYRLLLPAASGARSNDVGRVMLTTDATSFVQDTRRLGVTLARLQLVPLGVRLPDPLVAGLLLAALVLLTLLFHRMGWLAHVGVLVGAVLLFAATEALNTAGMAWMVAALGGAHLALWCRSLSPPVEEMPPAAPAAPTTSLAVSRPALSISRLRGGMIAWLRRDGLVLLLMMALALLVIYPVLPEPRSRIIGGYGDNVALVYLTGWMGQSILLLESPFVDPRLNYPDGLSLTATDLPYIGMLPVAPVTWALGAIFSYNLLIWINFWLSGYFAYLWVYHLTGSRAASLVTGLVFLLTPYRVVHAYGHLQLVFTFAMPLFFWALDHALRPPVPSWRALLLLSGATFLVGSSSQYYMIMCLITGGAYALLMLLPRPGYLLRYGWLTIISVFAGTLVSALPYLSQLGGVAYTPHNVLLTRIWSVDPVNFLLPSRLHPLWGSFFHRLRPEYYWGEKTLYISIVAGLLALVALCHPARRYLQQRWVWLGVALVAFVFALGTDLHLNNQPLQPDTPVWLPSYYLAQLPFGSLLRAWARFGIITILFVALLAGLGTAALLRNFPRWHWQISTLLCVLLVIDLLPGTVHTVPFGPRPVDLWLAEQPGDFAVAFLPPNESEIIYPAMFGSLYHAKQFPAFTHRTHHPQAYQEFADIALSFPSPNAIDRLHAMGFRYLVLYPGYYDGVGVPEWEMIQAALAQSPDLYVVTRVGAVVVVGFR